MCDLYPLYVLLHAVSEKTTDDKQPASVIKQYTEVTMLCLAVGMELVTIPNTFLRINMCRSLLSKHNNNIHSQGVTHNSKIILRNENTATLNEYFLHLTLLPIHAVITCRLHALVVGKS